MTQASAFSISPRQTALMMTVGFTTAVLLCVIGALALLIGAGWLVVQFASITLASIIEVSGAIGGTFVSADPLVKFFILATFFFFLWKLFQRPVKARIRRWL